MSNPESDSGRLMHWMNGVCNSHDDHTKHAWLQIADHAKKQQWRGERGAVFPDA